MKRSHPGASSESTSPQESSFNRFRFSPRPMQAMEQCYEEEPSGQDLFEVRSASWQESFPGACRVVEVFALALSGVF